MKKKIIWLQSRSANQSKVVHSNPSIWKPKDRADIIYTLEVSANILSFAATD